MKEYYGNYLGICVYNADPEHRGRVKVFIPHIMPALYEHWNKDGKDIKIQGVGANLQGGLSKEVVDTLTKILPWCEAATPIIGTCTAGHLNPDTHNWATTAANYATRAANCGSVNASSSSLNGSLVNSSTLGQSIVNATAYDPHFNPKTGVSGSCTYCAAITTNAANKLFGVQIQPTGSAMNYGPNLQAAGFQKVTYDPGTTYPPGAIKISNGGANGHMEMSTGDGQWSWNQKGAGPAYNGNATEVSVYVPTQAMYQNADPNAVYNPSALTSGNGAPSAGGCDQPPTTATANTVAPDKSAVTPSTAAPLGNPQANSVALGSEGPAGTPDHQGVIPHTDTSNDVIIGSGTVYGGPDTDLTTLLDIMPSQRPPELLAKYSPEFIARQEASMNARGMPTGTLTLAQAYQGAYGPLIPDKTVGSTYFPGGTILNVKNADGTPYNPSGNNPIGQYTVTDTGNAERSYHHMDFFTNSPSSYVGSQDNLHITVESLGTKQNGQYKKAQAMFGGTGMDSKTVGGGGQVGPAGNKTNIVNQTTPIRPSVTDTNGMAQGSFTYPNVGAFLWVFFQEGNPLFPVYFAASFGPDEWGSVYQKSSPPLDYTNPEDAGKNYAHMHMHRPNGAGFMQFTDSMGDASGDRRGIKIQSHSGSHLALNSDHAILYSSDDFYKQSDGHSFDTAMGNRELYTQGDHNHVTMGDHFVKIGNISQDAADAVSQIQNILNDANKLMLDNG